MQLYNSIKLGYLNRKLFLKSIAQIAFCLFTNKTNQSTSCILESKLNKNVTLVKLTFFFLSLCLRCVMWTLVGSCTN